jgi:hypothetical protein
MPGSLEGALSDTPASERAHKNQNAARFLSTILDGRHSLVAKDIITNRGLSTQGSYAPVFSSKQMSQKYLFVQERFFVQERVALDRNIVQVWSKGSKYKSGGRECGRRIDP